MATRAWHAVARYIRHESRLDPRLRELAILQVGYLERSPYEYSHHVKIGREFGVTDDDIRAIADETEGRPTHARSLEQGRAARRPRDDAAGLRSRSAPFRSCTQSSTTSGSRTSC